jgi:glycerate-2-kinase
MEEGHVIKNFNELATTPARTSLLTIAEAGYRSIKTSKVIRNAVVLENDVLSINENTYSLKEYKNIYVVGVGKCAYDSAVELEALLKEKLTGGVILDVRGGNGLKKIKCLVGTHPYPSDENVKHTAELLDFAKKVDEHDLVLMIVSGGGSTLLCQPEKHSVADEISLVKYLFKEGATIKELNTIRKHISKARGGQLATSYAHTTVAVLIFSDVPGDDLTTISSAPTILDETTLDDAKEVFAKYGADSSGFSVDFLFETPKDKELFKNIKNILILKNTTALEAMKKQAEDLGYTAEIKETKLQGEARVVAKELVEDIKMAKPRTVYLYGGETTVTISGPGKGGRNQEMSLSALSVVAEDELFASLASDGHDNTDFAGGIADKYTKGKAEDAGLNPEDFLYTNDSYTFFKSLQQGVVTGYTGANIADFVIVIKHER